MIKLIVLALALSFTTLSATNGHNHYHYGDEYSHGGDAKKLNKSAIQEIAKQEIKRLILEKKIHKSWKYMPVSKIGKSHYADSDDWVVGFNNLKIKNKKKQTLYIFVSIHGDIRGANYTGN